ncbi:HAD family hydrolase [Mariniflexile gromovii]|uniref:HAD family hydrolase n=1 Tax=Mariniflexile gromovii TaxID=362523 RepID=A0ABS4BPZ6_9FLAO|nr:HAD family hydrolase [Mariniflexile gromovii]MBP0902641.1 HAD family hydrolase [Mariniflexile gromovii]
MNKKAIILDLDNTIYPVSSIGEVLFSPLFQLILESGAHAEEFDLIKKDIMRKPFQKVASEYNFSKKLFEEGMNLLQETKCTMKMSVFEDYNEFKNISLKKFLVTTGFTKMQNSKVAQLGIINDFEEIHVVDPQLSDKTKKDVFVDILTRFKFDLSDVLVIGDDPNSEIKAAQELGIDAILYDIQNFNCNTTLKRITDFTQIKNL